jgi:hypothetical protein
MMIAVSIAIVTLLLAAMIGLRYFSPALRERMEMPKYRFQASLGRLPQETKERDDVKT